MSLLQLTQSHGAVTVSLLLPLLTVASGLAFRPAPASTPAAAHAEEPRTVAVATASVATSPITVCEIRTAAFTYTNDDDNFSIVLMDPTSGENVELGDSEGSSALRRLQRTEQGRFLWFHSEGRDFVIRDAALLDRADEIVEPQQRLGAAQGKLGGIQGREGGQQGRIGARQGRYGARLGELARREVRLHASLRHRNLSDSEERRIEAALDEIREEREQVQEAMQALGREQALIGARQAKLGARQAELGRQQAETSRQVMRELRALVREAVRSGRAIRLGSESY